MAIRLNCASGTDLRPAEDGWVNMDVVKRWPTNARDCDLVWDARTDKIPYGDSTVDEICAGYLLTHVSYRHHAPLVREMHRVLKPGGKLVVDEVDMATACRRWLSNPRDLDAIHILHGEVGTTHGEQFEEYDAHRSALTTSTLYDLLTKAGFRGVTRVQTHAPVVWYALTVTCTK